MGNGKLIVKVGLSGKDLLKFKIEGEGFEGDECINTIDEFQEILGLQTETQEDKPERARIVKIQKQGY